MLSFACGSLLTLRFSSLSPREIMSFPIHIAPFAKIVPEDFFFCRSCFPKNYRKKMRRQALFFPLYQRITTRKRFALTGIVRNFAGNLKTK